MKKIMRIGLLTTLVASRAFAAEPPTPPAGEKPQGKPPMHHMFEELDTNKDGQISKQEWVARGDKMFSETDANKDGTISADEMKAHHEAKRAEMEKHRTEAGGKPEGHGEHSKPEGHGKPSADAPKPVEKK